MSSVIVVALGGNALQKKGEAAAEAQERTAAQTAAQLIPLLRAGHKLVIVHGNGPQVGNIILHEEAINTPDVPTLPLDSGVAMSQGLIGYWLQQAFVNELNKESMSIAVSTLVTQTVVSSEDSAFSNPSKPIGPYYMTEQEARSIADERGFVVKEDAGRGWRRVVPSPRPLSILEKDTISLLLRNDVLVICAGGGGVPVVKTNEGYEGVEAVIDKDFSAAVVADMIDADMLLILTSVEAAMVNFGTPDQEVLGNVSVENMKQYVASGQFAPGSMLPKVLASIQFVEAKQHRHAVIASLLNVASAVEGASGTRIHS